MRDQAETPAEAQARVDKLYEEYGVEDDDKDSKAPRSLSQLCAQDVMTKMLQNPATRCRMNDPAFVELAQQVQGNPMLLQANDTGLLTLC